MAARTLAPCGQPQLRRQPTESVHHFVNERTANCSAPSVYHDRTSDLFNLSRSLIKNDDRGVCDHILTNEIVCVCWDTSVKRGRGRTTSCLWEHYLLDFQYWFEYFSQEAWTATEIKKYKRNANERACVCLCVCTCALAYFFPISIPAASPPPVVEQK